VGSTKKPKSVKLICGFIYKEEAVFHQATKILEKRFGRIDFQSEALDFTHTAFYAEEFGCDLKRRFISFKKLIPPETIAQIKIITNKIEKKLSRNSRRRINIDPGYLTQAKLVLATTKDYRHRIYLGQGIYAEITLFFEDKTFKPWEWTYPDYKTDAYIAVFNQIREIYARQI
jgi:hypothetical protein